MRLAGCIAINLLPKAATLFPSGIQLGIGVPGGTQTAISILQSALHINPRQEKVLLAVDFKNAFNERDRSIMARSIFGDSNFSHIHRLFNFIYNSPSNLFFHDGDSILSNNGVLQGEVLSSYSFAKSVDHIYTQVHSVGSPDITSVAIHDDLSIVDNFSSIVHVWHSLKGLCAAENIPININKTLLLWPLSSSPPTVITNFCHTEGISLVTGATKIIGTAIGLDDAKRISITNSTFTALNDTFFAVLNHPSVPTQITPHILRLCGISIAPYTISTLPPSISTGPAVAFDNQIINALSVKTNIPRADLVTESSSILRTFPCQKGGLGLRSQAELAPLSFLFSLSRSFDFFPLHIKNHLCDPNSPPVPLFSELLHTRQALVAMYPGLESILPLCSATGVPSPNPRAPRSRGSLQSKAVAHIDNHKLTALTRRASHDAEILHLTRQLSEFSDPLARRIFFISGCSNNKLAMSHHSSQLFYRFFFRLHAFSSSIPQICNGCGNLFTFDHPLFCPGLRRLTTTARHDSVVKSLSLFLNSLDLHTVPELRYGEQDRRRPDLTSSFPDSIRNVLADVAFIHTPSPSYSRLSTPRQFIMKANNKRTKYLDLIRQGHHDFYGLILSTFGRFGNEFIQFIHRAVKLAVKQKSSPLGLNQSQLAYCLIDQLLVCTHRGNANVLIEGFKYAQRGVGSGRPAGGTSAHFQNSSTAALCLDEEGVDPLMDDVCG